MDDQNPAEPSTPEPAAAQPPTPKPGGTAATGRALHAGSGTLPETAAAAHSRRATETALHEIRELLDTHIGRNDMQRKAFDTLHDELQQYKNSSLLNEFHRPVIRNLIQLYDHMVEIERHLPAWGPRKTGPTVPEFVDRLDEFVQNFTNLRCELTEVLARLEVETYEDRHDALQQERLKTLDRNLHRPVAVEPTTDSPETEPSDPGPQGRVLLAGEGHPTRRGHHSPSQRRTEIRGNIDG